MANTSPIKFTRAFTMRADAEFLDALDALRLAERPELSRSDMLRRLVFDEEKRQAAKRDRQKRSD